MVKNKPIHFLITDVDGDNHLICIKDKIKNLTGIYLVTWHKENVTCKHCLKHLEKKRTYRQVRTYIIPKEKTILMLYNGELEQE